MNYPDGADVELLQEIDIIANHDRYTFHICYTTSGLLYLVTYKNLVRMSVSRPCRNLSEANRSLRWLVIDYPGAIYLPGMGKSIVEKTKPAVLEQIKQQLALEEV